MEVRDMRVSYKQNVVYPYGGILLSNRKEWRIGTHYDMHEPQEKEVCSGKETWHKEHSLYDFISMRCPKRPISPQKVDQWLPRAGGGNGE